MDAFCACLHSIADPHEELYRSYSARSSRSSSINRYVDQSAKLLELELAIPNDIHRRTRSYSFTQSPHLLSQIGTTGSVSWDSSILLANLLSLFPDVVEGKAVLEMGCGIGVLGTYVVKELARCERYVFSDADIELLKLAQTNLQSNLAAHSLKKGKGSVGVPPCDFVQLEWTDPLAVKLVDKNQLPDLILASDVLYNEHIVPYFVNCLHSLSAINSRSTPWILGQELRSEHVHEAFLETALEKFEIWRFDFEVLHNKQNVHSILRDPNYVIYYGVPKPP